MPQRTCVGCRRKADRSRLLRVVAAGDGTLVPDPRTRLPGRGAWVHPDLGCLDQAVRRRAFARALRLQAPADLAAVREHLEQLPPAPPSTTSTNQSTVEIGSGSASDGHPMSSQQ
ncbi:YlxR family protein [Angustibacter speluncae]